MHATVYKLSIFIPTYNRSDYLRQCLTSVVVAADGLEHALEIVVSDNASSDNTSTVVHGFQERYGFIRYHRNSFNIGASKNIALAGLLARGRYLWVLGDDDAVSDAAIKVVLRKIEETCPDLIVCNYVVMDKDLKHVIRKSYYDVPRGIEAVYDRSTLLKLFGPDLGLVSSVVLKREILLAFDRVRAEKFIEYGFSHLYLIYGSIDNNCKTMYIGQQLVLNRAGNFGDYDWYKYFLDGLAMIFDSLKREGYTDKSIRAAKNSTLKKYLIPRIIFDRLNDDLPSGTHFRIWKFYPDCWSAWLLCLPILTVPILPLRMARWIKSRRRKYLDSR